jgi:hypothetical protein
MRLVQSRCYDSGSHVQYFELYSDALLKYHEGYPLIVAVEDRGSEGTLSFLYSSYISGSGRYPGGYKCRLFLLGSSGGETTGQVLRRYCSRIGVRWPLEVEANETHQVFDL